MKRLKLELPDLDKPDNMTTQEHAYRRLHHALITGSIAPGVPVTIRGLAEIMHTSPTPVREALRRLSSKNALTVLENRRVVVPQMTSSRFHELVSLRSMLELFAVERALPHISDALIDELKLIDDAMDIAVIEQDSKRLTILNQEFHTKMLSANPEQITMPMIESIWLQLGPFMHSAIAHVETFYTIDRHKQILIALHNRDLASLKQALAADIHDAVGRFDDQAMQKILHPK